MKDNSNFLKDIMDKFFGTKKVTPGFTVTKDLNGEFRWVGISTNRYIDREGEILSDAAHIKFEKYLNDHPEHQVKLMFWHEPLTAMEKSADLYYYDKQNGFFFFSGVLSEQEAGMLKKVKDARMSHGFFVLKKNDHIITEYISTEVSVLPGRYVANAHTEFTLDNLKEDSNMFENEAKRMEFVNVLGEERVLAMESNTQDKAAALATMRTEFKSLEEKYTKEMDEQMAKDVVEAAKPMVDGIVADVVKAMNMPGLQDTLTKMNEGIVKNAELVDRVEKLTEMVDFLKSTEDAKMEKALSPEAPYDWALSATKSDDNIIEDEDLDEVVKSEVKSHDPKFDWMEKLDSPLGGK